ncbi:PAAR domain-containing protein [Burkholderia cepacia]|uniref:PAAR domain-containing protein n=2 Tax=Burkholderia cepacia TaxID=292 RepID=A0ABM6NNK5_BURCE|nr:PAAR domain-containing protein [Burkholderia cepacia]ATF76383.1 PAAR domain-containing protein [Burkholderia cepacia]QCY05080.1 PAAR domain-containing protein [Burkholderia cepacia ATCC 25416]
MRHTRQFCGGLSTGASWLNVTFGQVAFRLSTSVSCSGNSRIIRNREGLHVRRNYLRVGDQSTSGGVVVDAIPTMSCDGVGLTYVGAKVTCPACKRVGVIVAEGPRWPGNLMGHEAALEGDKVACGCSPLPTMIASQSEMFQSFESDALVRMGFSATGGPVALELAAPKPSQGFCLSCMVAAAKNAAAMVVRG